ncbi:PIN domain-containing protein [Phaeobacter gallaeciensis]|uniref:PIN domain-containing protein n=2 Tax=Roseobacteraceae TaxID=2854170 RepID=A0A366WUH7_9RHOB|nr:PIN domain-containing protein [Phaeobacter gallaeciensis]MBT3140849.1 PIN domain-containing protein [Falsiruegeria litorea]RBW52797.1 PIN domain-containing protein [Phaeobacter gallaeciensis]
MKVVLDTCVLFPTVMREMLMGVADLGHFTPLWSTRILGEWARAAVKLGPTGTMQAEAEIALLRAAWPAAELPPAPGVEARLWLPDPADVHVLATAISGSADLIVTLNAKDFPRRTLSEEGLDRIDPDAFLCNFWREDPESVALIGAKVLAEARRLSGDAWDMRPLLKKARLPRLAKALG